MSSKRAGENNRQWTPAIVLEILSNSNVGRILTQKTRVHQEQAVLLNQVVARDDV